MRTLALILTCFLTLPVLAQDSDADYVMYQTILLKPLHGHGQQLREGLKAHNEKYHTEGSESVNVYMINSGPRFGTLSWVKGPTTWSNFDNPIAGDKHMDDWRENVAPHAEMVENGYWRLNDELSYMPEGLNTKLFQVRYFDIKERKGNNAEHIIGTISTVYKENSFDIGLSVFNNQANYGTGQDWAILWSHDSWASLDKDREFVTKYEEKFGNNSWNEFWEGWNEAVEFTGMEIHVLQDDLSVAGSND